MSSKPSARQRVITYEGFDEASPVLCNICSILFPTFTRFLMHCGHKHPRTTMNILPAETDGATVPLAKSTPIDLTASVDLQRVATSTSTSTSTSTTSVSSVAKSETPRAVEPMPQDYPQVRDFYTSATEMLGPMKELSAAFAVPVQEDAPKAENLDDLKRVAYKVKMAYKKFLDTRAKHETSLREYSSMTVARMNNLYIKVGRCYLESSPPPLPLPPLPFGASTTTSTSTTTTTTTTTKTKAPEAVDERDPKRARLTGSE